MGVHDFVCHIEQNDQVLYGIELLDRPMTIAEEIEDTDEDFQMMLDALEEEYRGCGAGIARLVLLPRSLTIDQVQALSLSDLASYPFRDEEYSWDDWDFPNYPGYREFLSDDAFPSDDHSIWHNDDHWIINFSPTTYDIFVSQLYFVKEIPVGWYIKVLEDDRNVITEYTSKDQLFQMVLERRD